MPRIAVLVVMILALPAQALAAKTPATQPGIVDIDNPPKGIFSDEWYVLMLKGQKSGHMHTTMERAKNAGRDLIRTQTTMTLEIGRAETRVGLTFEQSTEETLAGEPVSFKHRMLLGKIPSVTSGQIANGKVKVTTTQLGLTTGRRIYDLPTGAIMSWGTYREQIKRGLYPGLKYELSVYEPTVSPDRLTPTTMEVLDQETLDLFGRKVKAYRTKQTAKMQGATPKSETNIETTTWMTDAGTVVKMQMSVPPIDVPFEVITCPKAVAQAANNPAELMMDTLIHVGRKLDGGSAKSITYRLVTKGGGEVDLPETAMQKIIDNVNDIITLKLTRRSVRQAQAATQPKLASTRPAASTSEDLRPYLQASAELNFKDPVVADLARKAAGKEKDTSKLAARLCRFVHEYVQAKNLSIGFATASEVARSREGDCTEHGVLLAALGRAVGIPTRIVTGIVYTDEFAGQENVFVGHMWAQYWIAGEWVDLDAAFDQTDVDPTHIALGISAAGDSGLADLVASGWMSLGKLVLRVVEVK